MFTAMTIPMIPAIFNVKVKPNVKENILKFISVGAISSDVDLRKNSLTDAFWQQICQLTY